VKKGQDIVVRFPGVMIVHHNKPGQKLDVHAHDEHHLIIPLRGEVRLITDGNESRFGPGRMAYIPPQVEHGFVSTNPKEGERLILFFTNAFWKRVKGVRSPTRIVPGSQITKEILFHLLLHPKTRAAAGLIQTLGTVVSESIEAAQQMAGDTSIEHALARATDERVQRAVTYIEANYARDIRMTTLAKTCGLSTRNLTRIFSAEIGLGPKEALLKLRLERARHLLEEENMAVTDAAFAVGYQSLSGFIQAFQQLYGQLPSEIARR
jgi:AraC-like DNA-binding protein